MPALGDLRRDYSMQLETIIGFDSAWADKNPGAICAVSFAERRLVRFSPPRLVYFEEAADFIREEAGDSRCALLAMDQPVLVPNWTGLRPVERVARRMLDPLKSGVQPSNRGRSIFFGDDAPIWSFLDEIAFRQNPTAARNSDSGTFLIEVFPALALVSLIREIRNRRAAARYNPDAAGFRWSDWEMVVEALTRFSRKVGMHEVARHVYQYLGRKDPAKQDQDCLDAVICMLIGVIWRFGGAEASLVIGDYVMGHMVTPVIAETRGMIMAAADQLNVPVNLAWPSDSDHRFTYPRDLEKRHRMKSQAEPDTPGRAET